eukprot:gnl/MRDRNA2_/MRDRNA2_150266_c0_seq1.p1 gnl/MRDRNA2_/MRDRNA2_150266_c0~~gnl/MRDRNA2_/MRDRNA2_150266_c0_seq1.p1  ORF type:complete len:411 (+),score=82.09 gnl/MRDRNA2_/MRDRNA2_150266_c0_seq1:65-1297(+)
MIHSSDEGRQDESYFVKGPIPDELLPGLTRNFTASEITAIRHRVHLTSAQQDQECPTCLWVIGPPAVGKSTISATMCQQLFGSEENAVLVDGAVLRECHNGWKAVVDNGFQRNPRPLIHRDAWDKLKNSKVIEIKKKEILEEAMRQRQHICIPEAVASAKKIFDNIKMLDDAGYEQHLVCLWAPRTVLRRRGEARQAQEGKTFSMKTYVGSVASTLELAEHFVKTYSAQRCYIMTTDRFPNLVLSLSELRQYVRLAEEVPEAHSGERSTESRSLQMTRFKHAAQRTGHACGFIKMASKNLHAKEGVQQGNSQEDSIKEPVNECHAEGVNLGEVTLDVSDGMGESNDSELETVKLKRRVAELEAIVREFNAQQHYVKELEDELRRSKVQTEILTLALKSISRNDSGQLNIS